MRLKKAFVILIRNCLFKSKFNNFIEKAVQRLYEKGFDKIKENNWIVEERKEMIEVIRGKMELKHAFKQWKQHYNRTAIVENLVRLYRKKVNKSLKTNSLKLWKDAIFVHNTIVNRKDLLHSII